MLSKDGISLNTLENGTFSQPWIPKDNTELVPKLTRHIGSGSGGYADNIFIYATKELFDQELQSVNYKSLR